MKNYVLYDDRYLGPGFLIINKKNEEITKFLKIFIMNDYGFPNYGLRTFSIFGSDDSDEEYTIIDFTFTDTKNDLYKIFHNLCVNLNGNPIKTIDINIGDETTCENYNAITTFYDQLVASQSKKATEADIKQLSLTRLK